LKLAESLKAKNSSVTKTVNPFVNELNKLKETLVVTKGDNYVGAAEPQLRERLAELYSKVAQSFYKPNSAELDNLEALEARFNTAKADFRKIKDKHQPKVNELAKKNGLEPVTLKSFEDFVKEP